MAKKKVDLENDDFDKEIQEDVEEVSEDVEEAEEDVAAVEEDTEVGEEAVEEDVEAVEEDVADAEPASDDKPEEASQPKGKNTTLTVVLCLLNVAAALAFVFLLLLDFQKRQDWSYAVFMNELRIEGLPLKEEEDGISGSRVTGARQTLSSKQISETFSQRGGKGGGEFRVVDEPMPTRISPQYLTAAVLKDYFGNLGDPVPTLEDEIKRLKAKVPADIANAAETIVAQLKTELIKQSYARQVLLSLAYDTRQVDVIDKKITAAKGPALDALIKDAIQRRLLFDILAPCEIFRPGALAQTAKDKAEAADNSKLELFKKLEKIADLDSFKLDLLQTLLQKRFDVVVAEKFDGDVHLSSDWDREKRQTIEKRATIGFLLLAIASVHKLEPDPKQADRFAYAPLYPETGGSAGTPNLQRAQTILGLYEFAVAAQNLPVAWHILDDRVVRAIQIDREGFNILFKNKAEQFKEFDGKLSRNLAFIDRHAMALKALDDIVLEISKANQRLEVFQDQNKTALKIYEDRKGQLEDMTKKLIAARVETARQVAELQDLQKELYQAQKVLRDAQDQNIRLEQAIRAEENKARVSKGATP